MTDNPENDYTTKKVVHEALSDFVRTEMEDGVTFEEILEIFDLTPEEVFIKLFKDGLIDEEVLEAYILDFE